MHFPIDIQTRLEKGERLSIPELDAILQEFQDSINELANRHLHVAGNTIVKGRAIMYDGAGVKHYDPTIPSSQNKCIGVAMNNASIGGLVQNGVNTIVKNIGITLIPNQTYWASANGILTGTFPTSGISQIIGYAINLTDFMVVLDDPIELI